MTGRGRPPIGPAIKIRLDPDDLADVDKQAEEFRQTRAETVRALIHWALHHKCD